MAYTVAREHEGREQGPGSGEERQATELTPHSKKRKQGLPRLAFFLCPDRPWPAYAGRSETSPDSMTA